MLDEFERIKVCLSGIVLKVLKDNSRIGVIDDKIQDDTALNGIAYFPLILRLFLKKFVIRISDFTELTS